MITMSKLKYMLGIVAVSSLLVSCDNHIIEDYSWHSWKPGMVYCTNGDVGSYEECVAKGHQPEAVIFYVDSNNETDGAAYAVALRDSYEGAFEDTDTVYSAQGTSADITELDGETNTTALRYFQIQSPIAQNVAAKYFIPSVAEMYKLYAARNVVNSVIEQCGGDRLPTDDKNCWYWTSTECEGATTDRAWRFSLYSGRFEQADKHASLPTRPILLIRLNKAEQDL